MHCLSNKCTQAAQGCKLQPGDVQAKPAMTAQAPAIAASCLVELEHLIWRQLCRRTASRPACWLPSCIAPSVLHKAPAVWGAAVAGNARLHGRCAARCCIRCRLLILWGWRRAEWVGWVRSRPQHTATTAKQLPSGCSCARKRPHAVWSGQGLGAATRGCEPRCRVLSAALTSPSTM